jgi:hypothetical protein
MREKAKELLSIMWMEIAMVAALVGFVWLLSLLKK